jgi:hypothetical protein
LSAVSTGTLAMCDGVVQLILLLLYIESSLRIKTWQADKADLSLNLTEQQWKDAERMTRL